jgi:hypothetical protein
MAITGVDYNLITASDLRDSAGHTMKLIKLNGFIGTYEIGGVVLDPQWFDLREITFMTAEPTTGMPLSGPSEPWSLVTINSIMRVDQGIANGGDATGIFEWRIIPFLYDGTSFNELADGSSLAFPEGLETIILLVGAP